MIKVVLIMLSKALAFLLFLSTAAWAQTPREAPHPFSPDADLPALTGYIATPPCTLTDATTVTPTVSSACITGGVRKSKMSYLWPLGGPGHTLNVPAGLPAGGGVAFEFRITHTSGNSPTTPDGPILQVGAFNIPLASLNGGQPAWCTTASCIDRLECSSINASIMDCGVLVAMTPTSIGLQFVNSASCASASGPGCTTSATNMTGANLFVGCIGSYNGSSATAAFGDSLSSPYNQIYSAALTNLQGLMVYTYLSTPVSGNVSFTATATGSSYPGLTVMGFSGAVASPLDQSTSTPATTSGTSIQPGSLTPGPNELIATCTALAVSSGSTSGVAITSPFTLGPVVNSVSGTTEGSAMGYQIQTTATAQNPTTSWTASADAVAGMATFK